MAKRTHKKIPAIKQDSVEDTINAETQELLKLIEHKLFYSAQNVKRQSLWQVAHSVKHYLQMAQPHHPTVERLIKAGNLLRKYCDSDAVKKGYQSKVLDVAEQLADTASTVHLLTGYLMGIRAARESLEPEKVASVDRLTNPGTKPVTDEQLRQSQLYWALRN